MSDYMDSSGTYVHWNLTFVRVVQDWELVFLVAFLNLFYTWKTYLRETKCCGSQLIIIGLE